MGSSGRVGESSRDVTAGRTEVTTAPTTPVRATAATIGTTTGDDLLGQVSAVLLPNTWTLAARRTSEREYSTPVTSALAPTVMVPVDSTTPCISQCQSPGWRGRGARRTLKSVLAATVNAPRVYQKTVPAVTPPVSEIAAFAPMENAPPMEMMKMDPGGPLRVKVVPAAICKSSSATTTARPPPM
jgi:hypothetical protein